MKALPRKQLQALERAHAREPRVHFLWVEAGDTDADIAQQRDRLIADGTASPGDRFIPVGGKDA